ncbi:MAG: hypothetical protein B7X53_00290, partial [Hyphomonas sp. 34-62-18]
MNHPLNRRVAPLAAVFLLGLIGACGEPPKPDASDTDHGEATVEDYVRGPHNGRLLEDGAFALEMTIFETGVPPQYRIYPYKDGAPLDPSSVDLTVKLHRLG